MNIFVLDTDPTICAKYHCDKHIIKMITETCQILSTVTRIIQNFDVPDYLYKKTHMNHPCVKWVNESYHNMYWLTLLLKSLIDEYDHRFDKKEKFTVARKISNYFKNEFIYGINFQYDKFKITNWVKCMPDKYNFNSIQISYRNYYNNDKSHLHKWTNRETPFWVKTNKNN